MKPLPSLRQLAYLRALAEHRHFGRAAAACLVTQSTLSAGLRELETLLGATLVERDRRHVALTPLGEEAVTRAQRILAEAGDLVDAIAAAGQPLAGLLRLGVIPTVGPYLLPKVLPDLRAAFPALRLYLREERTAVLLDHIRAGRLDVAVVALPYDLGGLEFALVGEEGVVVACAVGHPLAREKTVNPARLAGETLLLLEDGHCLRGHALAACRLDKAGQDESLQATSMATLMQMVAGGLGVTLVPDMAVELEVGRAPGIVARPLAERRLARRIALVWRHGAARERDYLLLAGALRDAMPPAAIPPARRVRPAPAKKNRTKENAA